MSNYNEKNYKPAEKLTVAGIAAVIVVGVFVVCVILILAKSLFPSNNDSTPEGVYTGTKTSQNDVQSKAEITDESSVAEIVESAVDSSADAEADSQEDTESVADGETATLTQTAYLRSSNDENADPILSISAGETVTVVERPSDSEYVHVQYLTYDGWVWNGYLS
jgi:uncharacterized protein YgiM (DUF1202 family)